MTSQPLPIDNPASIYPLRWRSHDRRRAAIAVLCVVALHGWLVWRWQGALTGPAREPGLTPPLRVTLRLIPPRPTPPPPPPPQPRRPETPLAAATPRKPVVTQARLRQPSPAGEAAAPAAPLDRAVISITAAEAALRAEAPASAAIAAPALLDTEASRRAIRASARTPSMSTLAAAASEEPRPPSAQERLGGAVKSASRGDCLKGEYAGAGMGILSLPFIAVATARGACAQ